MYERLKVASAAMLLLVASATPAPAVTAVEVGRLSSTRDVAVLQDVAPDVGPAIYENDLTAPSSLLSAYTCPTGRGSASFTSDGLHMRIDGKCREGSSFPAIQLPLVGLSLQDGEVRAQVKLLTNVRRPSFYFTTRADHEQGNDYYSMFWPSTLFAHIGRNYDGSGRRIKEQAIADGVVRGRDWNSVAVRMLGARLWLLVNDQVVLSIDDGGAEGGPLDGSGLRINFRQFEQNTPPGEDAILVRNLSASPLQGDGSNRAPSFSGFATNAPGGSQAPAGSENPTDGGAALGEAACMEEVDLPPVVHIVPPASETPNSAWAGGWEGRWQGESPRSRLIIEVIDNDKALVIYAWNSYTDRNGAPVQAGYFRTWATIDGNRLHFTHPPLQLDFSFEMGDDGSSVSGTRISLGQEWTILMKRCTL